MYYIGHILFCGLTINVGNMIQNIPNALTLHDGWKLPFCEMQYENMQAKVHCFKTIAFFIFISIACYESYLKHPNHKCFKNTR